VYLIQGGKKEIETRQITNSNFSEMHQWWYSSLGVWIVDLNPGQVKPKDYIKWLFAASPLSKEHSGGSTSIS
jgi:hypothetical protein